MPKLSEETQLARKMQARDAWMLMVLCGKTLKQALSETGITYEIYRRWITEDPEGLQAIRQAAFAGEIETMAHIVANQNKIIEQLIRDAISNTIEPAQRVMVHQHLNGLLSNYMELHRGSSDEIKKILSGPQLEAGESRFAPGMRPVLEVTTGADGSITVTPQTPVVVPGELRDSDDQ